MARTVGDQKAARQPCPKGQWLASDNQKRAHDSGRWALPWALEPGV